MLFKGFFCQIVLLLLVSEQEEGERRESGVRSREAGVGKKETGGRGYKWVANFKNRLLIQDKEVFTFCGKNAAGITIQGLTHHKNFNIPLKKLLFVQT